MLSRLHVESREGGHEEDSRKRDLCIDEGNKRQKRSFRNECWKHLRDKQCVEGGRLYIRVTLDTPCHRVGQIGQGAPLTLLLDVTGSIGKTQTPVAAQEVCKASAATASPRPQRLQ